MGNKPAKKPEPKKEEPKKEEPKKEEPKKEETKKDDKPTEKEISNFMEMISLFTNDPTYATVLTAASGASVHEKLGTALVNISCVLGAGVSLQSALLEMEFEQRKDAPTTILKVNSIVSKMMGKYTRKVGDDYIKMLLGGIIDELNAAKDLKLELNPALIKTPNPEDQAKENLPRLTEWCQKIMDRIFDEKLVEETPRELRAICYYIQACGDKLSLSQDSIFPMIAGFILLRYICPGISSPNNCGITKDVPSEEVRGNLTILAKIFQKLGNLETFGEDAKPMMAINEWIEKNKENCVKYLHQIVKDPKGVNFDDLKKPEEKAAKFEEFPIEDVKLVFKIMKDNNKKFVTQLGEKGATITKLLE